MDDADIIISMGLAADKSDPIFILLDITEWDIEDPSGKDIDVYRKVRDDIIIRVRALIEKIDNMVIDDSVV